MTTDEVKACHGVPRATTEPDLVAAYSKAYSHENEAPASEKQLDFIQRLMAERPSFVLETPVTTKKNASRLIDKLLAMPKELDRSAGGDHNLITLLRNVPDGYYALPSKTGTNDLDFIVVKTKEMRRYVNRYLGGHGQVRIKSSEQREFAQELAKLSGDLLTASQVRFGRQLGRCGRCGHTLTDEESRARGIGPDCWSKL